MAEEKRGFYRNFASIYGVLVLQNVVTLSVNLADNIMLGAYSESALAGVAAVNQIQFILQQLVLAFGDGLVILGSQYWGKGQSGPIKRVSATAMHCGLLVAGILFLLVSLFPQESLRIFTSEPAIIGEGVAYLGVIRYTYLFFTITQILLASLRSVELVKISFQLSVFAFFVNCAVNYVLIFGNFGAPRMGAVGAAIGTLVARVLELLVLLYYISKKNQRLSLCIRDFVCVDLVLARDYLKLVIPMGIAQGLWGINTALQTVILGHMTAAAIAANSAASTLFLMVKSSAVGAASAASVIIGKAVGQGELSQVKEYAVRLQRLFFMLGLVGGVLLFFLRVPILSFYNLNEETMRMANQFLIILSVVFVGMSYQMPVNNGVIRGGGDSIFVVNLNLVSTWLIVLPLSYVMAFWADASPAVVVCCLNSDQIFKCLPAWLKIRSGTWIHKLTREEAAG